MKAISLWQPWASAMFPPVDLKRIETRSWSTKVRGPVAIHAAKKQSKELEDFFNDNNIDRLQARGVAPFSLIVGSFYDLPFGCIVGFGILVDCVHLTESNLAQRPELRAKLNSNEQGWGNYAEGRFAWVFENLVRIEPIPWKGSQGFFDVDLAV